MPGAINCKGQPFSVVWATPQTKHVSIMRDTHTLVIEL